MIGTFSEKAEVVCVATFTSTKDLSVSSSFIYGNLSSHEAAPSTFYLVMLGWKFRNQRNICSAGWLSTTLCRLSLFATTEVASVQLSTTRVRGFAWVRAASEKSDSLLELPPISSTFIVILHRDGHTSR